MKYIRLLHDFTILPICIIQYYLKKLLTIFKQAKFQKGIYVLRSESLIVTAKAEWTNNPEKRTIGNYISKLYYK